MMTVCNMLIHGCVGEVICHDSLMPDKFTDGWKVNPTLQFSGLPSIRRISKEEYADNPYSGQPDTTPVECCKRTGISGKEPAAFFMGLMTADIQNRISKENYESGCNVE